MFGWTNLLDIGLGGALGAALSFAAQNKLLRGTELGGAINDVCRDIRGLEEVGSHYWRLPPEHEDVGDLAVLIRSASKRIGGRIKLLSEEYWIFDFDAWDALTRFRQSITSGNFDVDGRAPEPLRVTGMQDRANELEAALRRGRRSILGLL